MTEYRQTMVNNGRGHLIPVPSFMEQAHLDLLAQRFVAYDDDVYIVGYPKSGITWMQQIVHLLANQGEQGEMRLSEAVPRLEVMPAARRDVLAAWQQMPRPRYFCSHLPIQLMPGVHTSRAKYVVLVRNPKDTAVSLYYHEHARQGYRGSWPDFFERFFQGQVNFGPYFDHVLEWWQASQQMKQVKFVTYEQMQADLAPVIQEVARFIGLGAGEALIQQVMEGSRFAAMAANPRTNLSWISLPPGAQPHLRQGVVGDWRRHFTVEQNIRFDALITAKTLGTGLEFDYGREKLPDR